jgi:hypothetical protein
MIYGKEREATTLFSNKEKKPRLVHLSTKFIRKFAEDISSRTQKPWPPWFKQRPIL